MSPTFTDPASGRQYEVDETGQSRWIGPPPPPPVLIPAAQQPAGRPRATGGTRATGGARRWLIPAGTGLLGLVIGAGAASGGSHASTTPSEATQTATATVTVTQPADATAAASTETETTTETVTAPAATAPAAASSSIHGDGTFLVGSDVQAGTYKSDAPSSGNCYWARLGRGTDNIIANNNSVGQSVVTIARGDYEFQSSGCETWTKVK